MGSPRPGRRSIAASSPTEGSDPSSSPISAAVSGSPSGASAIVWAPCTRVSAPSYSGREVISAIAGVRGMTDRKSASIDSLTASIQCASSMMNSAGWVRASDVVLTSAVNRRRRASGSIGGQRHIGVGDAQQIIEQQQILRVGIRKLFPDLRAGGLAVEVGHAHAGPQQPRHRMERHLVGVGFAEGPKHVHPATGCGRRGLPRQPGSCRCPAVPPHSPHPPRPPIACSSRAPTAAISQPRPTRPASARPTSPSRGLDRRQLARARPVRRPP